MLQAKAHFKVHSALMLHMHTCRAHACTYAGYLHAHATCAGAPQVRYVVANMDGAPAWVVLWIKWLLPERAWDALILANLYYLRAVEDVKSRFLQNG